MRQEKQETENQDFFTHTLDCGLRIICAQSPTQVVYAGLAVDAGTRDESDSESGMAHFTEHMSFKGTPRLSARQVSARMESVGGDLNAYTGKEETFFYTTFLRQHLDRAVRLLTDMVLHSTFPQDEMVKEAEVVIEEIQCYDDQPAELIYDDFESVIFGEHPLGRSILGRAERLRQLTSADMHAFHSRMYRPERMVLFVMGQIDPHEVVRLAEMEMLRYGIEKPSAQPIPRLAPSFCIPPSQPIIHREKGTHQAHVLMGAPAYPATDPRHMHLFMLNNLLGGPCMSSRLNIALRERYGLVYAVESTTMCHSDSGHWCLYFGCSPHDVKRCLKLVNKELLRLTDAPLSKRSLDALRQQMKGQLAVAGDSFENAAIGMAKRFLHYGTTRTLKQIFERMDSITPEDLHHTAQEIFLPERMQTLIYT